MISVYVGEKRQTFYNADYIGGGDEGSIYFFQTKASAVKLLKSPLNIDYFGHSGEDHVIRYRAASRIGELADKFAAFPKSLPDNVLAPELPVMDDTGTMIGYEMPFIPNAMPLYRFLDKRYRDINSISNKIMCGMFIRLHELISALHSRNIVIGDLNPSNILNNENNLYLVDTDGVQFDKFLCKSISEEYVDPLLCVQPNEWSNTPLILEKPYNFNSDWYAFTVLLVQAFLNVHPYGGRHPSFPSFRDRILEKVSIFEKNVEWPSSALHQEILPEELSKQLVGAFTWSKRGPFPIELLEELKWKTCSKCGITHARESCPSCSLRILKSIKKPNSFKCQDTDIIVNDILQTSGFITDAAIVDKELRYIYYDGEQVKREGNVALAKGDPTRDLKVRLGKNVTWLSSRCMNNNILAFLRHDGTVADKIEIDRGPGGEPLFDITGDTLYYIENNKLYYTYDLYSEDGGAAPQPLLSQALGSPTGISYIGMGSRNRTYMWVGPRFGLTYHLNHDGQEARLFTQKNEYPVSLPYRIKGEVKDVHCKFSETRCWLFIKTMHNGRSLNHCIVIRSSGKILAHHSHHPGAYDGWTCNPEGSCTFGEHRLVVPTDRGIAIVGIKEKKFVCMIREETKDYVSKEDKLLVATDGVLVVTDKKITKLQGMEKVIYDKWPD